MGQASQSLLVTPRNFWSLLKLPKASLDLPAEPSAFTVKFFLTDHLGASQSRPEPPRASRRAVFFYWWLRLVVVVVVAVVVAVEPNLENRIWRSDSQRDFQQDFQ